jgi:hypothetical protein
MSLFYAFRIVSLEEFGISDWESLPLLSLASLHQVVLLLNLLVFPLARPFGVVCIGLFISEDATFNCNCVFISVGKVIFVRQTKSCFPTLSSTAWMSCGILNCCLLMSPRIYLKRLPSFIRLSFCSLLSLSKWAVVKY